MVQENVRTPGSQVGMWLPAKVAIPALIFGETFSLLLIAPLAIVGARYGVEQIFGTIPVFGQGFTLPNIIFLYFGTFCGMALATSMFGRAAVELITFMLGPDTFLARYYLVWAFVALVLGFLVASSGPKVMKNFVKTSAAFMVIVLIGMIYYIFSHYGIEHILSAQPADPILVDGDPIMGRRWSIVSAFEINVGLGFSWALLYGQWTRLAKTEGIAYHGCMWGWGALASFCGVFGILAALAIQKYDPTTWLVDVGTNTGSMILPFVGLILFAVANVSSVATLIYTGAVSWKAYKPGMTSRKCLLIASVPTVFLLLIPDLYEQVGRIYTLVGLSCVLYGAVAVVDLLFISKGVYDMRPAYNRKEGYRYWHGLNPAVIVAWAFGIAFYFWTLNPFMWESPNGLFPYLSACLPTFFITGIVYYIAMKVWVLKIFPLQIGPEEDEQL